MKKMLLIEDDKDLAKMYSRKFSASGWDIYICHDGAESLQVAKNNRFDVIVLDLMLPGISGVDVLEMLRSDSKTVRIPVVVYTNFGDNFNREKCMAYGADEFVLKVDSTPESLLETVNKCVLLRSAEDIS